MSLPIFSLKRPLIISVEGIISAGKTSLIVGVLIPLWEKMGLKVRVVSEPIHKWGEILPIFYADPKRWAYHIQTKIYVDRICESNEMWNKYKDHTDIFILDRSIFSDPQFMKVNYELGNVSDMEMKHYLEWCSMWDKVMPFVPDLFIYLDLSIEESLRRAKERAREGEQHVSAEYQILLKKYHDETFGLWLNTNGKNIRVYKIDSGVDYKNDESVKQKISDDIISYVNNCVLRGM